MQTSPRTRRFAALLPIAVLAGGLAVQVAYAAYLSDRLWFFGDDWDFLLLRGLTGDPELSLWAAHNEHWSTVPIVLFRFMFAVFGLDSYLPYALMPIAAHVAIWVVMYALVRRIGVTPWAAVVSVWTGAFLAGGIGAEDTLWDFQVGFLGSAAFGLLALLFLQRDGRLRVLAAWVVLVLSLASSGVGLVFVGWAGLFVLLRRGVIHAVAVGAVPAVVYVTWFALIGHEASSASSKDITLFPLLMVQGIDGVWSNAMEMPGAGPLVLVSLVAVVFFKEQSQPAFALSASGLGALLAAFALFAYSRSGLGEGTAASSRYLYFGIVFCIPALALAIELAGRRLAGRPYGHPVAIGLVLALTAALGLAHLNSFADSRVVVQDDLKHRFAATLRLLDEGAPLLGDHPSPTYDEALTTDRMRSKKVRGGLGDVRVKRSELLDARGQLQVMVRGGGANKAIPAARRVAWEGLSSDGSTPALLDACVTRVVTGEEAFLRFSVPKAGASVVVSTEDNAEIQTSLLDDEDESEPVRWPVESDDLVNVESTAAGKDLRVRLPHGEVTVCPTGESP